MKTSNENVYEKTMRLLMTANQETMLDVQPMEEDNEEDGLGQPIEGQSSILSFFTRRNNNCMEEDWMEKEYSVVAKGRSIEFEWEKENMHRNSK